MDNQSKFEYQKDNHSVILWPNYIFQTCPNHLRLADRLKVLMETSLLKLKMLLFSHLLLRQVWQL